MDDKRSSRWGGFVQRYEYLLIYIAFVTTLTLLAAFWKG